ncbi:MAG: ribonuclease D [Deltaproteobacteria bacterium]|nr:ribonuclease D [Deltaproteobacteria bacterium]
MITTIEELKAFVSHARQSGCVAIDTEFVWERSYYPRLGLIQAGLSEGECFLIDAPRFKDLSILGELLSDGSVVKILHDAQQDLTILRRATGSYPVNIFDTRLVAGFAGLSSNISLRDLIRDIFSITLHKTETRTDWLKRPLSEAQLKYALEDVRYLPGAREKLLSRVKAHDREKWVKEELLKYNDSSLYEDKDPFSQYQRLKGAGRFTGRDLAVLRELAAWREKEAIMEDRPRGHVLKDDALVALARRKVRSFNDIKGIKGFNDKEAKRYGRVIIEAVERGLSINENDYPQPFANNGVDECLNARVDLALAYMKGKCLASNIDMALVASRAEVSDFISNKETAGREGLPLGRGWRKEFVGHELIDLMAGKNKITLNPDTGLPELVRES